MIRLDISGLLRHSLRMETSYSSCMLGVGQLFLISDEDPCRWANTDDDSIQKLAWLIPFGPDHFLRITF